MFFISSIFHMVLPIHKSDYGKLAGEDSVLDAMRAGGVTSGHFMFPHCSSMKDYASPEHMAKVNQGPVGFLTVLPPGGAKIGKSLLQWILYSFFVSLVCAYVAGLTVAPGADFTTVLRVCGTIAFATYGIGAIPESIWKGIRWGITGKFVFEGLVYGIATGAIFASMWPDAS